MRTLCLACLVLLSCSKSEEPAATEPASEPAAKKDVPKAPGASTASKAAPPKANDRELKCDELISKDLVQEMCTGQGALEPNKISIKGSCRYFAKASTKNRVDLSFEKVAASSWISRKRRYPAQPRAEKRGSRTVVRYGAYPFAIEVAQFAAKTPECSEAKLIEMAKKIGDRLPTEAPPKTGENQACDGLLTKDELVQTCGGGKGVFATQFENGRDIYCHRTGPGGMIFIVTKHRDGTVAKAGENVASGFPDAVSLAEGPYVIELKSTGGGAVCTKPQLTTLAKKVAERLR